MAVDFKKRVIDTNIEKHILTAMIVSDEFLGKVRGIVDSSLFASSPVSILSGWILDYWDTYHTSPKRSIEAIYDSNKGSIPEGDSDLIQDLLHSMNEEWEQNQINIPFMYEKAKDFFQVQELKRISKRIDSLTREGKVKEAIKTYLEFGKKGTAVDVPEYKSILKDKEFIKEALEQRDVDSVRFNGCLGELIGDLEMGWLVSFLGPMKRGKSHWLQELAMQSVMEGRNTVFVSLEIDVKRLSKRFYRQIAGAVDGDGEEGGMYVSIPQFDCTLNQNNSCSNQRRVCRVGLDEQSDRYKPCTACRPIKRGSKFDVNIYQHIIEKPKLNLHLLKRKIKDFNRQYGGNNLRMNSYPAFSATVNDIEILLDTLWLREGFATKTLVVDYADILATPSSKLSERGNIDYTWKQLKRMASERNILVLTASQGTRKSIEKDDIGQTDVAEDIRKLAHVDVMIGIAQTPLEKELNCCRLSVLAHRWKSFSPRRQALILQVLEISQPYIDGYIISKNRGESEEHEEERREN